MPTHFYNAIYIILTFAVVIGYINHRYIHMQSTIAIMLASLMVSMVLIVIGQMGFEGIEKFVELSLAKIDFHKLLMNGMLSFLLFAGALTVDINNLKKYKWEVGILATLSTIASAFLVGTAIYYILHWLGVNMDYIYCLLFGALISPTDPIAVLAMCKEIKAPSSLTTCVSGESLFNDGVGIVIFLTLYQVAFGGGTPTFGSVSLLFLQEAIGGIIYGVLLGIGGYKLMAGVKDHTIQILVTLGIVTGGYGLAEALGISGPLAMVVAGIFIGNRGRQFTMDKASRQALDTFWELIDEILNAVLFLMIGLELLIIHISRIELIAGLITIPLVLLIRYITVAAPMSLFKLKRKYVPHTVNVMVWGGLRGGLAVALALAIPPSNPYRNIILAMTYGVVVFAIVVQGLTVKPLIKLTRE